MEVTKRLSEYLCSTSWTDIEQPVVLRAKELILECIGTALAGSTTKAGRAVTAYAREAGGHSEASVIGGALQSPLAYALYVNGTLSHLQELEDTTNKGGPNAVHSIVAALALGEKLGLSGRSILEAFIVGYQVQSAIAFGCPGAPNRAWDIGSFFGTFGCAAVAAKMLGLDVDKTRIALGIACSQPAGLFQHVGTMTHFIEFGMACRNGVESALLAAKGMTAAKDGLESPHGFCAVCVGEGNYDLERIIAGLNEDFILGPQGQSIVSVKKYPCCYRAHRAIDAVLEMIEQHHISYRDVAEVEAAVNSYTPIPLRYHEPKDGEEARFSLEHCLAGAILQRKVDLETFSDEATQSQEFTEARGKIRVVVHPEFPAERSFTREPVIIRLKDGRVFSKEAREIRNPTWTEEHAKYQDCAGRVLSTEEVGRLETLVLNLESLDNVQEIANVFRGSAKR